jgi:predicted RecA/RadA family phage recombinase
MQNYVHKGETLTILAPRAVNSGDGVLLGSIFGIARFTAAISTSVEVLRIGVHDLAKDTSTFSSGDKVYWDDTNHVATSASTGNREIGAAELSNPDGTSALGGGSGDATVRVALNPVSIGTSAASQTGAQSVTINLTAAQIKALHGTPIQVLPAPGAGKVIVPGESLFVFTYGTVQMTAGSTVGLVAHGGTTPFISGGSVPTAAITGAVNSNTALGPASATTGVALTVNTGVDIAASGSEFATGDGTATYTLYYRVVPGA